ncbi:MAG: exodeoxyribonuclease VII large subunit [Actinomycetales bacterium]
MTSVTPPRRVLPEKAADTTAEQPWPVRLLSVKIAEYVARMSPVWVEGQVVELRRRPGTSTAYLTLRDPDVDMSLSVTVPVGLLERLPGPIADGARVVVNAKAEFWEKRGSLSLSARDIRPVGVGELLARIEHLKRVLAAEGLFAAERKRPLPFLPRTVGLVCGRASAAERDVVENARKRWPAVRFAVREVAVQGTNAVAEVTAAVQELDRDTDVDVIVVARGGGSVEDLLPFSNEALLRAVAAAFTPVVSAIGHEVDSPLLDLVADVRASTPTDAAKLVVPDVAEQLAGIRRARGRLLRAVEQRLDRELALLTTIRERPVLAEPHQIVEIRDADVRSALDRSRTALGARLQRASDEARHLAAQVRALSPAATLERGYAVVQQQRGSVVRDADQVEDDEPLRVRLARGELAVRATKR